MKIQLLLHSFLPSLLLAASRQSEAEASQPVILNGKWFSYRCYFVVGKHTTNPLSMPTMNVGTGMLIRMNEWLAFSSPDRANSTLRRVFMTSEEIQK